MSWENFEPKEYKGTSPLPRDTPFQKGVVEQFSEERLFGFILGDDRVRYFFHIRDVQLDSLLRQRPACIPGTKVQFRNVRRNTKAFSDLNRQLRDPHAGEMSLIDDQAVDLETYRETSFVRDFYPDRHVGFLLRPSGDELGFLERHIISVPEAVSTLKQGSLVYHGVSLRRRSDQRNETDNERKATRPSRFELTDARKSVEVFDVEICNAPPITFEEWQESVRSVETADTWGNVFRDVTPIPHDVIEIPKPVEHRSILDLEFRNVPLRKLGVRKIA